MEKWKNLSHVLSRKYTSDQIARTTNKTLRRGRAADPVNIHMLTDRIEFELTIMLVRPTNASTNVMYALAAVIPPPGLNVSTDCPPPKIPASSKPYSKTASISSVHVTNWKGLTTDIRHYPREQYLRKKRKKRSVAGAECVDAFLYIHLCAR